MRKSIASIALIRREFEGQTLWLAQWNEGWQAYSFVGGHKHDDESFRECLVREIEEELGLRGGTDFDVAEPPLQLAYTAWSRSTRQETAYTMELFAIALRDDEALQSLDANRANRWLTEEEIRAGKCANGQAISETVALIFDKARLWAHKHDAE